MFKGKVGGKVFNHIFGEKNLCIHGEDAKRLLAYSPNTLRDTKMSMSWITMIQKEKNFISLLFYFLFKVGLTMPKNHYTILSL